jgi:hypothetical protein
MHSLRFAFSLYMLLCILLWLLFKWIIIHLNSCWNFVSRRVHCWGKWPAQAFCFFFFSKNKRKKNRFMIFWHIYFKVWIFLCCKKNINLVFRIPGFRRNVTNIHIYQKNVFLCVAYGQYPNMFWTLFFYTKNIGSFENVFSHGFLKHNKIIFLHFWILQHVCKTLKGIG